jgi:hypothetical protein
MFFAVGGSSLRKWLWAAILGGMVLMPPFSRAQQVEPRDSPLPSSPDESEAKPAVDPVTTSSPVPKTHRFWDRENILLFSGVAIFRGLDYASTRNMQARGRKEILLAPEVVNNDAAFASLEAAGTMTSIGISYIFHRTGHHKLERWMSIGHIGVAAFGDIRNYCLVSKHPR